MAVLRIEIQTDASGAITGFKNLATEGESSMNSLGVSGVALGNIIADLAMKGFDLAAGALRGLKAEAASWIEAAAGQEAATATLNQALATTGQFTQGLSERYHEMATAFQRTTTAGDDELLPLMGKLITVGGVQEKQMKSTVQAALDLAAGLDMDLSQAFGLVAKAAAGNVEMLGRYGIQVKTTGDKTKDLQAVVEALSKKFGGQATSDAQTFTGQMKQLEEVVGDVREELGGPLIRALEPFVALAKEGAIAVGDFVAAHKQEILLGVTKALELAVSIMADFASIVVTFLPVFDKLNALWGIWVTGIGGAVKGLGYLTAMVKSELGASMIAAGEDIQAFASNTREAVSAVTANQEAIEKQIQTVRDRLTRGLQEASVGTDKNTRSVVENTDKQKEWAKALEDSWNATAKVAEQMSADKVNEGTKAVNRYAEALAILRGNADAAGEAASSMGKKIAGASEQAARSATQIGKGHGGPLTNNPEMGMSADMDALFGNMGANREGSVSASMRLDGETIDPNTPGLSELAKLARESAQQVGGYFRQFVSEAAAALERGDIGAVGKLSTGLSSSVGSLSKMGLVNASSQQVADKALLVLATLSAESAQLKANMEAAAATAAREAIREQQAANRQSDRETADRIVQGIARAASGGGFSSGPGADAAGVNDDNERNDALRSRGGFTSRS